MLQSKIVNRNFVLEVVKILICTHYISALEDLKDHLENPDNFVEMKFLLLEQKYLELLYKGNSIEALKVIYFVANIRIKRHIL